MNSFLVLLICSWIDLSDVLVSSIPNCQELHKFIDKEYKEFLLDLNIQLRSLPRIQVRSREDISELRVRIVIIVLFGMILMRMITILCLLSRRTPLKEFSIYSIFKIPHINTSHLLVFK